MRTAVAVAAESVCLGYFAAIEYVDLFPWNNIRDGNGQERADVAAIALQLAAIGATGRPGRR